MGFLTGLFREARKRLMTRDSDMGTFRDTLNELIAGKDSLGDEEISAKVEQLKETTNDLPDSEDKSKLLRFLEDFKNVKAQDEATAKTAGDAVADLFERLDSDAMKDAPDFEEAPEKAPEETVPPTPGDKEQEDGAEELEKSEEAADGDPNPSCTLEEIYQFMKKRMAEDEAAEEKIGPGKEQEAADGDGCEGKEQEITSDHAPIKVTLDRKGTAAGLAELFETAKNGGRR